MKLKTRIETSRSMYKRGFTLLEILIVVTIIGLLATIAVSNFMIARDNSRITRIRTNLRQIESAKEQWAIENNKNAGAPIASVTDLSDYFRSGQVGPVVNETYEPNPLGTPATALLPVKIGPYNAGDEIVAQ